MNASTRGTLRVIGWMLAIAMASDGPMTALAYGSVPAWVLLGGFLLGGALYATRGH